MFSSPKVAVLESKLDIYEELSREMLAKLESAVDKITEGNNKIANVLTKHESRLDESDRADQAILELVKRVETNLQELEKKVEDNQKMLWGVTWTAAALIGILQILPILGLQLTPAPANAMMEPVASAVDGSR